MHVWNKMRISCVEVVEGGASERIRDSGTWFSTQCRCVQIEYSLLDKQPQPRINPMLIANS